MKKIILILISIAILAMLAMSYSDYKTFAIRRELYRESVRIQELISKYEKILNKSDDIRAKVDILKQKEINDSELEAILQKSETFLTKAEGVKAKHIERINEFNQISERYNGLSNQKLLFKNRLPEKIIMKTQQQPSADR